MEECLLGRPVEVRFHPALSAHRGRSVHASTFLRRRLIVLDSELRQDRRELRRILTHEIFHFVWMRLDNAARKSYESLLARELRQRATGELGWSAEWRKKELSTYDRRQRSRKWRDYACESFCDTAAWLFASAGRHAEFTLPRAARLARRGWFETTFPKSEFFI